MSNISCLFDTISSGGFDRAMTTLYGEQNLPHQRERWCRLLEQYNELFADSDTPRLFSAPGRTEISGNHTDHQRGCVVAASINLDMIAAAAKNGCNCVRIKSEGFDFQQVDLSDLSVHPDEVNTTPALIPRHRCHLP